MENSQNTEVNPTTMRLFLWSGIVLVIALIVAQGFFMGFIPLLSPTLSPEQVSDIFVERRSDILIGCLIQMIGWSLYALWAIPIIVFIRKMERGIPLLTYASLVNCGGGSVVFILIPLTWAVAAFRAGSVSPDSIMLMNDWVVYLFLYTWVPFTIWLFIVAAAILLNRNEEAPYPRWVAFASIWTGILISPAGTISFFRTGPFAWDGLITFWLVTIVFFSWMVVMTVMSFKAITNMEKRQSGDLADSALRAGAPSSLSTP